MNTESKNSQFDRDRARNLLVRHPRFNRINELIEECIEDTYESGEPSCLALEGTMGVGKSTLVKAYANSFKKRFTDTQVIHPVLYVATPSPATINKLSQKILQSLGDPLPTAHSRQDPTARVISHLRKCRVQLVILDEFQHMINSPTDYRLRTVSDWLKGVIKEVGIPFVVVGIEGEVSQVLDFNPQLGRLFIPQTLEPFSFDPKNAQSVKEFNILIQKIEEGLQFWIAEDIDRVDLLTRIYFGTNGITSFITKLMKQSAKRADSEGYENIQLSHISYAYERWIAKKVKKNIKGKLFEGASMVIPQTPKEDKPQVTENVKKGRKKKREKASQVFTTR